MQIQLTATKTIHLQGATVLEDTSRFLCKFSRVNFGIHICGIIHVYLTSINYWNCIKIIRQCYVKKCVKCCAQTTRNNTFFSICAGAENWNFLDGRCLLPEWTNCTFIHGVTWRYIGVIFSNDFGRFYVLFYLCLGLNLCRRNIDEGTAQGRTSKFQSQLKVYFPSCIALWLSTYCRIFIAVCHCE